MTVGARIEALVDKADFLTLPEVAHLCAGGETPILRSHSEAVARFFDHKSRGMAGREQGVMLLNRDAMHGLCVLDPAGRRRGPA